MPQTDPQPAAPTALTNAIAQHVAPPPTPSAPIYLLLDELFHRAVTLTCALVPMLPMEVVMIIDALECPLLASPEMLAERFAAVQAAQAATCVAPEAHEAAVDGDNIYSVPALASAALQVPLLHPPALQSFLNDFSRTHGVTASRITLEAAQRASARMIALVTRPYGHATTPTPNPNPTHAADPSAGRGEVRGVEFLVPAVGSHHSPTRRGSPSRSHNPDTNPNPSPTKGVERLDNSSTLNSTLDPSPTSYPNPPPPARVPPVRQLLLSLCCGYTVCIPLAAEATSPNPNPPPGAALAPYLPPLSPFSPPGLTSVVPRPPSQWPPKAIRLLTSALSLPQREGTESLSSADGLTLLTTGPDAARTVFGIRPSLLLLRYAVYRHVLVLLEQWWGEAMLGFAWGPGARAFPNPNPNPPAFATTDTPNQNPNPNHVFPWSPCPANMNTLFDAAEPEARRASGAVSVRYIADFPILLR